MNINDEKLQGITLKDTRVQKETPYSAGDHIGHAILICAACGHLIENENRDKALPVCPSCKEGHTWYKVSEY